MQHFELTHEHIALLRAANVSCNGGVEAGTAGLNMTNPYGGGYMYDAMAHVLGIVGYLSPGIIEHLNTLHDQITTALQIILATGAFEVGVYEADDYKQNWRAV